MGRGEIFDAKFKRALAEQSELADLYHVASFDEPTKRELREQIAEAVRNTAAMPISKGGT
jgi:cobalamin biosynthesis Mg chelatase CobN